jgi:transposase
MVKTIISDKTYSTAQKELKKLKIEGTLFKKLQAVKLAYEYGIKDTADFLGIFPVSIRNWAKLINNNEIDSLKIGSKHKDGIKLKTYHKEQIARWIKMNPNITIQLIVQKLRDKFNLKISLSTARRAMKLVGFSYITPRKNHYKQDKKETVEFKKKSTK